VDKAEDPSVEGERRAHVQEEEEQGRRMRRLATSLGRHATARSLLLFGDVACISGSLCCMYKTGGEEGSQGGRHLIQRLYAVRS
jgi:hypothetical protein